jgi:dihydropyrimidinase
MPGGIDSHCHLDQPAWGSAESADDFRSGSISRRIRRPHLHHSLRHAWPGMSTLDAFARAFSRSQGRSIIDYGLHGVITGSSSGAVSSELEHLAREGVSSVKVFMTYDELFVGDELFLDVLYAARGLGMLVMVHAENDAGIRRTTQRLIDSGRTGLRYHTVAHSEVMEREATHRAAALAEIAGGGLRSCMCLAPSLPSRWPLPDRATST